MSGEERLLILRARQGDAEAFGALIAARRSPLVLLVAATLGDWNEAEDALQEALWKAFTHLPGLREPEAFDGWLRRIVINVARDHLRSALGRVRREGAPAGHPGDLEALLAATSGPGTAPDALWADREACGAILEAIAALPPLQRRAGRLSWVAGVPAAEVARLLGISPDSVHAALHRARHRLGAMFYAKGDWRRDVERMADGIVRLAGYPGMVENIVQVVRKARPQLPVAAVDLHATAEMRLRLFWAEAPALEPPPPAEEALPLEGLADAAGFDLEPFGQRLSRFTVGGRLYGLPYADTPHLFLYNAEMLARVGLPLPAHDWTWEEFFGYCRRLAAAGLPPCDAASPNTWDVMLVGEELGATREHPEPLADAVAFVRDWRRQGFAAPHEVPDWCFGQWLSCRHCFFTLQYGHGPGLFRDPRYTGFRWGVAPYPRFRRSDPPVRYWFHWALQIAGTAPDPTEAFAVARAVFEAGPVPALDDLPAYRTPEVLRAWRGQPLPLGRECLFELDAATGPLYVPAHFIALPGAEPALTAMLEEQLSPAEGIARVREGVAAYRTGARVTFGD